MGARTNRFTFLAHVIKDPILMKGEKTTGRTIISVVPDYNSPSAQYTTLPVMAMGKKAPVFVAMVKKGDLILLEGRILASTKITPSGKYYVQPVFKILDFLVLKRDLKTPIEETDYITTLHAYSPERFMRIKEEGEK